jgi:hypothetical protein
MFCSQKIKPIENKAINKLIKELIYAKIQTNNKYDESFFVKAQMIQLGETNIALSLAEEFTK